MKRNLTLVIVLFITTTTLGLQRTNAQANTKLSNLVNPTAVNQHLFPNNNNGRDLGSAGKSWRILYIDSSVYLKDSLFIHSRGDYNTFIGLKAGNSITSGSQNTGGGWHALGSTTTGYQNTAFGLAALFSNTTGNDNTALGKSTLYYNNTGSWNTGLGFQALFNNTGGNFNTATGAYTLFINQNGSENTAFGYSALRVNSSGGLNSAFGENALFNNTIGGYNTASGVNALFSNTIGSTNIAMGFQAGYSNTDGSNNVYLGSNADGSAHLSNTVALGANVKAIQSNTIILGTGQKVGIGTNNPTTLLHVTSQTEPIAVYGVTNGAQATGVLGEANNGTLAYGIWGKSTSGYAGFFNGNLGYTGNFVKVSDQRLKENIKPLDKVLDKIMLLKPSVYSYKNEFKKMNLPQGGQTGFIAQEMEKIFPQLVKTIADKQTDATKVSEYKGIDYVGLIPLLTKAIQEQQQEINELKQEIKSLSGNTVINDRTLAGKTIQVSDAVISQNTPNPFSSNTSIQYNIPARFKSAQMVVTDANGTVVKQVALNTTGKGAININAYNLTSGTYTYSLVVDGNTVESKKMLVGK